ncbi:MAG: saccharopine dehydrogenase NADP-binding domain-containing protein [Pseudomonadota bacterium]|nr:saccharopine dehydrogenase NADP-binding domain-containing protein [Pseudomonadota bacterium]
MNKELDLIVFGATSFVGKIICRYLANERIEPNFSWAMAARSEEKLESLRATFGNGAEQIPIIVAESFDKAALAALCDRTAVVLSTVGPYALYGEALVEACVAAGTDYCDLTGESQWMKRMISRYSDQARLSGARIVHACGFDSLPSDLGVKFLQQQAQARFGEPCSTIKMRVKAMKGGASGGTVASGVNAFKEAARDPAVRKEMKDWYSLCPEAHRNTAKQRHVNMEYDKDFNSWVGPFIMASVNTRVVLRTNALLNEQYGRQFYYDEGSLTGTGDAGRKAAKRVALGTKLFGAVLMLTPLQWLALKFFLPKPGEGPSPDEQRAGFFDLRFFGRTALGEEVRVKVTGDRDPGYGSTAKMIAQAAISLRRDVDKSQLEGGFWTPGSAFGEALLLRLQSSAGLTFEVVNTAAD